ncbi:TetR family transcriptional regulator [Flavobacterium sp. 1]|uniref:TetR/AcrR family transcriptional regulator n=1 Tax=Flavobacterium sp. 1 TaxID=2035200 RepID=UPI000C23F670|nr:TetR/AcrR family transcriptional regulator [Flavobacterium sp. 1]PJJ09005.1 TetR family transcriptional regulator [Flavobacterium sp. 1]
MSKAEQTRQLIIEKTASLFNKNGYAGTSLSDITAATGLTKGSIYGNFKNKEEVVVAVFKHSSGELSKKMGEAIATENKAYNQLIAFTDFYRNNWSPIFEKGGCPLLNSAIEADDAMPFMKTTVQHSFVNWAERVAKIIELGIEKKEFNKEINPKDYANTFIMLIEGGILLSKLANKPDNLYLALNRVVKIINEEIVE